MGKLKSRDRAITLAVVFANRVHPNWTPIDAALAYEGIVVQYIVRTVGQSNNPRLTARTHRYKGWFPPRSALQFLFQGHAGLLIVKDASLASFLFALGAYVAGWKRLGLCQEPILFEQKGGLADVVSLLRRLGIFLRLAFGSISSDVVSVVPWRGTNPTARTAMFRFVSFPGWALQPLPRREEDRDLSILCVGKLGLPRKRHDWIIDAVEKLPLSLNLVFVGTLRGEGNAGAAEAEKYYNSLLLRLSQLPSNINWEIHKNLPFESVQNFYLKASVFCLPADSEPFAYSVFEAMNAGLPVLISDDNGTAGYVVQSNGGLVFEARSFSDFSSKLEGLIASRSLRQRFRPSELGRLSRLESGKTFVDELLKASTRI